MATEKAGYFDTHTDWIDPEGALRASFRAMDATGRREAVERAVAVFPGQQAKAAVRNIAAEVDDEQLGREHGPATIRRAQELIRRIQQGACSR